jgi:hypothetical protein
MPPGHHTVHVGAARYYLHGGAFYQKKPGGFFPVQAPVGAVVFSLPIGAMALLVGGITCYLYNDVYYRRASQGYVVVEQPPGVVAVKETSPVVPSHQTAGETVTITAARLNVRSGPGLNFPVVQYIRKLEAVWINGYAPEWLYVELPDCSFGWLMLEFTSAFDLPPGHHIGQPGLAIRPHLFQLFIHTVVEKNHLLVETAMNGIAFLFQIL